MRLPSGYRLVVEGYSGTNRILNKAKIKSTSRHKFTVKGGAPSWKSSKQTCISCSTMKSGFIALDLATEEVEWIKNWL